MRTNIFQYHVEDRNYTNEEISKIISHSYYTHSTLAGGVFKKQTLGSLAEGLFTFIPIIVSLTSVAVVIYGFILMDKLYTYDYKTNDIFTGREITAFLNKDYDFILFPTDHCQNVRDLLSHKYIDAEVPLASSASFFGFSIAVLDA